MISIFSDAVCPIKMHFSCRELAQQSAFKHHVWLVRLIQSVQSKRVLFTHFISVCIAGVQVISSTGELLNNVWPFSPFAMKDTTNLSENVSVPGTDT